MCCYNNEKYIAKAIESVIAQTYKNWKLQVVDDCSTDRSREIIKEYYKNYLNINAFFKYENQQKVGNKL